MRLVKYEALGNDFLVMAAGPGGLAPARVRALCDRHRGPGADGLMVRAPRAASLLLFNADGSAAGFSGNGLRAAALDAALERGAPGPVELELAGRRYAFQVEAGDPDQVSLELEGPARVLRPATGADLPGGAGPPDPSAWVVDVGNPHLVLVGTGPAPEARLEELRHGIPFAPGGINATWLVIRGTADLETTTFERGVGRTRACASAALAAFLVARELGRVGSRVAVAMAGGTLEVAGDRDRARLGGPVRWVGEIRCAA